VTGVLLLGAGGSAAANVLDALRRSQRDYFVTGADASPVKLHLSSADERFVIPRADAPGYLEALVVGIQKFRCEIVHPQPDPDVRAVGRLRDQLPALTYLPSQDALDLAADKLAFAARLRSCGVPIPDSVSFSSRDDVVSGTEQLLNAHETVWVRARTGAGARASLPVRTATQALAWVEWWEDERGLGVNEFMAAERLPGAEFAYQSVWQDGMLIAGQARERVEYLYGHLTPSGQTSTPAVARTVSAPQVDQTAQQAILALDPSPRGVYCVDLKTAADGTVKVTEINAGRFFTTSNFFAAAGLNMPDLLMRCALGEHPTPLPSSPLPPDLHWIRMVDMGYALVPGDELDPWVSTGP
jgi:hypothetical protein